MGIAPIELGLGDQPFEQIGHSGATMVSTEVEDYSGGTRHLGNHRMCLVNLQGKSSKGALHVKKMADCQKMTTDPNGPAHETHRLQP